MTDKIDMQKSNFFFLFVFVAEGNERKNRIIVHRLSPNFPSTMNDSISCSQQTKASIVEINTHLEWRIAFDIHSFRLRVWSLRYLSHSAAWFCLWFASVGWVRLRDWFVRKWGPYFAAVHIDVSNHWTHFIKHLHRTHSHACKWITTKNCDHFAPAAESKTKIQYHLMFSAISSFH